MRFFHLADLHLGKRLGELCLLPDQEYILNQILSLVDEHHPDAILIAGDIYDKATPSAESVAVFDDFLTALSARNQPVMLISGNHDSPERLNFGGRIMAKENIYLAGIYSGHLEPILLADAYGEVVFYLLPFIKPVQVRRYYPEAAIESYNEALFFALTTRPLDTERRHILVAHQFITAGETLPELCESEQVSIGGLDSIDSAVFAGFDYVALGHLHRAQAIGGEHIRYAGSPLKYSFSEALHHKSLTMVELQEKGTLHATCLPLTPLHDLREIKGPLHKLLSPEIYEAANHEDYLHITLTDEEDLVSPLDRLRNIYPNVMKMDFANSRTASNTEESAADNIRAKTPEELFSDFYKLQQNSELDQDKLAIVKGLFTELEADS